MANKDRFTTEQVSAALIAARGLKSVAARSLNCDWNTVDRYVRTYATCKDALKVAREGIIDLSEGKLFQAINEGEAWAIALALKTIGKERGYVERSEVTGEGGGPITIRELIVEMPAEPES